MENIYSSLILVETNSDTLVLINLKQINALHL
jgi:hypothetical protein